MPPATSRPPGRPVGRPLGRTPAFQSTRPAIRSSTPTTDDRSKPSKPEPKILLQKYFKSVGPRTYAAQLMQAGNGNHYLVLTEGRRDERTDELRKTKLFIFSEDFEAFSGMLKGMFTHIQAHPVPEDVKQKRARFWAKKNRTESR